MRSRESIISGTYDICSFPYLTINAADFRLIPLDRNTYSVTRVAQERVIFRKFYSLKFITLGMDVLVDRARRWKYYMNNFNKEVDNFIVLNYL